MPNDTSQKPVVLYVDDQPQRASELRKAAEEYDSGRLAREFLFQHLASFSELNSWYQHHRGTFVSLVVLDVDFTQAEDESQLLGFPEVGIKPLADRLDSRALQGFIIYHRMRQTGLDRVVPVLFTSCFAALEHAREFADFIVYPGHGSCSFVAEESGPGALSELVKGIDSQALRPLDDERRRRWRELHRMAVGRSRKMAMLCHDIERIGPSEGTVLILGRPGTGKELCAQALHRCSARWADDERRRLPLTVNMVALEKNLVLDELFGHERGAFTDAKTDRVGVFEAAHGSSVFLDEIGDIDTNLQQKLLRVIEYRQVRRLGSSVENEVDTRVIAATNRPVEQLQTQFRWDFYTRMVQQALPVPSLRERWELETAETLESDVNELTRFIVDEMNRNPRHRRKLEPDRTAIRFLTQLVTQYVDGSSRMFEGEMRSLRNLVERAYERAQYDNAPTLGMGQLASAATRLQALSTTQGFVEPAGAGQTTERTFSSLNLAEIERKAIAEALAKAGNNQTRAAELLGIHRDTLRNKLRQYGAP